MATLEKITYALTSSVKVAPYQYIKPEISAVVTIDPGDNIEKVFDDLSETVKKEMKKQEKQIAKDYKANK